MNRAQRVTFRAILVTFTIVALFVASTAGANAESPLGAFAVILVLGVLAGLIVAGLVVWVMKGFSEEPPQDDDTSDDEPPPPRAYKSSPRANPPQ